MDERDLRGLIDQVKAGGLSRRAFVRAHGGGGAGGAAGDPASGLCGRGDGAVAAGLQADQARRRRAAEGAVVAGADPAQSALRGRHQGPGRLAPVLRAAGRLGRRRQPAADPGRDDSGPRGRHAGGRRQVGDLEAEEGRDLARRQAVHRRRLSSSPGNIPAIRRRRPSPAASYKDVTVEKVDQHTVRREIPAADAVLGRRLRRLRRAASFPSTCSPTTSAPSRARRRPTSSRSAPGPTCSRTSSRATWSPA